MQFEDTFSSGNRIKAWYNPTTKVQSFSEKPSVRLGLCQQLGIVKRYGCNGSFLDVCSAESPWAYTDFDPRAPLAGQFAPKWNASKQLWAFQRSAAGGPAFGEGNLHWMYAGLLDGVEAQAPNRGAPAKSFPLNVTFDLSRLHPKMISHGMGYYDRWGTPFNAAQYRMQTVIFGHSAYIDRGGWASGPLEYNLVRPVASRHALATCSSILYEISPDVWGTSSEAAKAGTWDHVKVTWDNGLVIEANNADFSWSASGAGVVARSSPPFCSLDGKVLIGTP